MVPLIQWGRFTLTHPQRVTRSECLQLENSVLIAFGVFERLLSPSILVVELMNQLMWRKLDFRGFRATVFVCLENSSGIQIERLFSENLYFFRINTKIGKKK